jgi:hypothetical protein
MISKGSATASFILRTVMLKITILFYQRLGVHPIKTIEVIGVSVDLLTNSKGDQIR